MTGGAVLPKEAGDEVQSLDAQREESKKQQEHKSNACPLTCFLLKWARESRHRRVVRLLFK